MVLTFFGNNQISDYQIVSEKFTICGNAIRDNHNITVAVYNNLDWVVMSTFDKYPSIEIYTDHD